MVNKMKLPLILIFTFCVPAVFATEPTPAINMTKPLMDEKGKPLINGFEATPTDPKCDKCPVLTIGSAISHALNGQYDDERGLDGGQKWARSALAERIAGQKDAHLTAKEADTIEKLVERAYGGLVIKQIVPLIDPNKKVPELQ